MNSHVPTRLYLYSSLPLLINYRDFNVPCPSNPPLFASLASLSEVLRFKIRPSSLSDRFPTSSPYVALQNWQALYLPADSLYTALSPTTPREREKTISAEAVIRLCHGAVLSIFVLDHNHSDPLPQHAEYHLQAALQSHLDFPGVFEKISLLGRLGSICALGLLRLSKWHNFGVQSGIVTAWGNMVGAEIAQRVVALAEDDSLGWEAVWRVGG